MTDRLTDTLNFQTQALLLRSERQRVIASNIANADTPGYQARDMDFAQALRDAVGPDGSGEGASTQLGAQRLAATSKSHLPLATSSSPTARLNYALAAQTNLDSNSVDMDRERASFADNSVKYEATLRFINAQVKTLNSAITGQ